MILNPIYLKQQLQRFLTEDLGFGDPTAELYPEQNQTGYFIAKQPGLICGQVLPQQVYDLLGSATYTPLVADGQPVKAGMKIGTVQGATATLLTGERTILNLMQRLSGIATATHTAVTTLADPTIKITDTRKTMPGLRMLDKYAVTVGGGYNHRLGLDHGIMLKDNHIAAAGGVKEAIQRAKRLAGPMTRIEIEVETKAQLQAAVLAEADVIMLDNQTPETLKSWRLFIPEHILTEASGGITLATLPQYKNSGVDFISLGYLTNAVMPLDISFDLDGVIKS